jgi:hypothetical protein
MATNPTNSTSVNITSLPKAQLAVPTDFLVLQTNNGTQIVSFSSFNVVKTDINGNATIVGAVTGNVAQFTNTRVTSISSSRYCTSNGTPGITLPVNPGREYYDSFTITNGLITSAVPTSVDYLRNPIYTNLLTQLTAASANLVTKSVYKNLFIYELAVPVSQGASTAVVTWTPVNTFTADVNSSTFKSAGAFSIMPGNGTSLGFTLSTSPYISSPSWTPYVPGSTTGQIGFTLNVGMIVPTATNFMVRVTIPY